MISSKSKNVRVIPRLDIKGPNLIKGLQFDGHRVLGTPEVFAEIYYLEGADELLLYDSVASLYQRNTILETIERTAEKVFIPLIISGGLRSVEDIRSVLRAGADKVAINTAAIENPQLLKDASRAFGAQCIVANIEYFKQDDGRREVWVDYGRQRTHMDAYEWVERVIDLGVGEIYLSSIRSDGMGAGFDVEFIERVATTVPIPVIAAGGAGNKTHFLEAAQKGCVDAVSAASCFHYYYATPPGDDRRWMSFNVPRLRMGEQIDSGNIDFIKEGYGGFRDIMVDRLSLVELKKYLIENEVSVRPLGQKKTMQKGTKKWAAPRL
jgi:imidazole glycerol-phosphate synthase subunit HisF